MSIQIPRLMASTPIAGTLAPTTQFTQQLNQIIAAIESALNGLQTQETQLQATEQAQAAQIATQTKLLQSVSFAEQLTISATAQAASATITISSHTRVYLDELVAVNAGTINNVPFGTDALIYYDDPSRAGGSVTYAYTTDPTQSPTSATHPGRVFVGEVLAPGSAAASPSTGTGATPPTQPQPKPTAGAQP